MANFEDASCDNITKIIYVNTLLECEIVWYNLPILLWVFLVSVICVARIQGTWALCGSFSCSSTSTNQIDTTKLVLHWQIYDETPAKPGLKLRPPMF